VTASGAPSSAPARPLLEVVAVSKSFGAVAALTGVDLALGAGEVVALVGENGAGKSTLIKILAGVLAADAGEVRLDGAPVELATPAAAAAHGIAVLHQDLHLCDNLSVAENLFLGRAPLRSRALGWIDRRRLEVAAQAALARVGLDCDPRQPLRELGPATRQLVEIARALDQDARVVVMDEPTSSLDARDAARLLALVEELRRRGAGVLYVSHRLGEVVRVADRAVVLRDGRVAGELARGLVDERSLVRLMVGRELAAAAADRPAVAPPTPRRRPLLAVHELRVADGAPAVSFELHAGEILGLYGLVGAGRTELLETIFGLRRAASGKVEMTAAARGGTSAVRGAKEIRAKGVVRTTPVAMVPEDRKTQGLLVEMTVAENLALPELARRPLHARRRRREEERRATELVRRFDIRPPLPHAEVGRLSGGNQQKVALAKWLALDPRVLLLDEPTRGVDVGARAEIHRELGALRDRGVGILLSSADSAEILALADRVLVLHRGAVAGVVEGDDRSEETLVGLAAGGAAASPPESAAGRS
jgi:ABC-type sugar transport system ATPase subunit